MGSRDYWAIGALALAASLFGGTVSALWIKGNPREQVIEARAVHLYDSEGEIRARLVLGRQGEPGLAFYDQRGEPRLTFGLRSDGEGTLNFLDENGKVVSSAP